MGHAAEPESAPPGARPRGARGRPTTVASTPSASWVTRTRRPLEVLLPPELPVEGKAFRQLANLAALKHPGGGSVLRVRATPDFHPGDSGVAIGSVLHTRGLVVPGAVGTDINCGMRLHVADLRVDGLPRQARRLRGAHEGPLLLRHPGRGHVLAGRRGALRATASPAGSLETIGSAAGLLRPGRTWRSWRSESMRVHLGGALEGDPAWAPSGLREARRGARRGPGHHRRRQPLRRGAARGGRARPGAGLGVGRARRASSRS